ncbi:hypothetical protein J4558_24085 [Leptolyngbya sp. 15MV]|nr:hypothetical protein J4558_24085 [Leptolyngbya sp. 15MV]
MTHTLDHAGILVPRLDAAVPLLARLGFTLTRKWSQAREPGKAMNWEDVLAWLAA